MRNHKLHQLCLSAAGNLGIYRPARDIYRLFFDRERENRRNIFKLHRTLLPSNALVFDIGAHTGEYSDIFASLGARVVALEPNPALTAILRRTSPRKVTIIEAAAGREVGKSRLRLCSASAMSSMSADWIATTQRHERLKGFAWQEEVEVTVITIDSLRKQFGDPDFIKIDVEGFEFQVLSGMSKQPGLLSFEFNTEAMDACFNCLETFSPLSQFNFVLGTPARMHLSNWVAKPELVQHLRSVVSAQTFGDVFVSLVPK